jgi:hypothetical protein
MTDPLRFAENQHQTNMTNAEREYDLRPLINFDELVELLREYDSLDDSIVEAVANHDNKIVDLIIGGDMSALGDYVAMIVKARFASDGHTLVKQQGQYKSDICDIAKGIF